MCIQIPHESLIFLLAPFRGGKSELANLPGALDKTFLSKTHLADALEASNISSKLMCKLFCQIFLRHQHLSSSPSTSCNFPLCLLAARRR